MKVRYCHMLQYFLPAVCWLAVAQTGDIWLRCYKFCAHLVQKACYQVSLMDLPQQRYLFTSCEVAEKNSHFVMCKGILLGPAMLAFRKKKSL